MRSTTWITVLVGLFMFQSLWNVAAAFCVHEEQTQVQQSYHFGHHQNTLCLSSSNESHPQHSSHQASEPANKQFKNTVNDVKIGEDHQDHLPSMTHLIVQNQQSIHLVPHQAIEYSPKFDWKNLYQAPDLLQQTPPPVFSPLMAG
jgi:hypothetical protein